ncbi:MAG TPA: helix-turn-helix transcriptional regulator [Mycobacteriales bacterium]|nr:helix-turn-helix transcriptional regulator [Mycobacteriales bacterium]
MTATLTPARLDGDGLRRRELAGFLRSRRERITPEQVGLPPGGRRRTPGLRREEVAQLAGVGITWYTWLEQGRDIKVSDQVLEAISRTLLLDPHERSHLFTLAGSAVTAVAAEHDSIAPEVHALLAKLHPYPAVVTNGRYDLLAYNAAYLALVGDLDALPFEERNTMWLIFTNPLMHCCLLDRSEVLRRIVGQFRAAMADHVADPAWKCLVKRLKKASPEFAELWAKHDVAAPENLIKQFMHSDLGLLRFHYTNLWLSQQLGLRLVSYTPADDATADAVTTFDSLTPRSLLVEPAAVSAAAR